MSRLSRAPCSPCPAPGFGTSAGTGAGRCRCSGPAVGVRGDDQHRLSAAAMLKHFRNVATSLRAAARVCGGSSAGLRLGFDSPVHFAGAALRRQRRATAQEEPPAAEAEEMKVRKCLAWKQEKVIPCLPLAGESVLPARGSSLPRLWQLRDPPAAAEPGAPRAPSCGAGWREAAFVLWGLGPRSALDPPPGAGSKVHRRASIARHVPDGRRAGEGWAGAPGRAPSWMDVCPSQTAGRGDAGRQPPERGRALPARAAARVAELRG